MLLKKYEVNSNFKELEHREHNAHIFYRNLICSEQRRLERHYPFEGCFNFRDIGGYRNQDGKRVKKAFILCRKIKRMTNKIFSLSDLNIAIQFDLRKKKSWIKEEVFEEMGAKYINISVIPMEGVIN